MYKNNFNVSIFFQTTPISRMCKIEIDFGNNVMFYILAFSNWQYAEDTDLYLPTDNEDWLIRFLRPCKYYPESARKLVS